MIDDLIRLIELGVITIDSIKDSAIQAEVQANLVAQ